MLKQWLQITQFKYLKTPKWRWTLHNSSSGSFSNSGEYSSLKALRKAFRSQYPGNNVLEMPVKLIFLEGFGLQDEPIQTVYESDFTKILGAD